MKKVVISCVLIMLMFFTFCGNVEAQSNYQTDLTANIQEVKTSQEVIVTIGLKNIPVMQKGLNAYHTKIDYDTNVFEEIKISDFESLNNWTNLQYNKANHELVAINKHGVYTDGAITKLRLRVKSNAMVGETKIKIRQFISSQGIEDIYVEDDEIVFDEFETDIENWTEFVYFFTGEAFFNWLEKLDYSRCKKKDFVENILKDALIINFNYTSTLEDVYKISDKNIYHIHGYLRKVQSSFLQSNNILPSFSTVEEAEAFSDEIILSHRYNNDIIKSEIQFGSPDISKESVSKDLINTFGKENYEDINAFRDIENFIDVASKNIELNIPKLKRFLEEKDIDEVVIMGHSLGGPDDLYYEQVLVPLFKDIKWVIFVYDTINTEFAEKNNLKNVEYRNWNNEIIQ